VFVYRDTSDHPASGQNDAAYWYDLPVAGAGPDAPANVVEEARGPFEPLVSSADPPGAARRASEAPDAARPDQAPDGAGPDDRREEREETVHDRARKLEQIKDLYLTAEAIGEANVDKHFDQLLAQQRDLISEYFRPPGPAGPAAAGGPPPGPADPSEGARLAADQPRAW
jgi:hypothetical protein